MKKSWRISILALILLALLLVLAGCAAPGQQGVSSGGNPQTTGESQSAQTNGAATLTAEQAQAIALEHAGLTAEQVTGLRAEYDLDDGVPEYDVEFRQGRWEYEYEIHAETGEILSWDKDD